MSNIVHLKFPKNAPVPKDGIPQLLAGFSQHRRTPEDVFWLKENAEILNILESTGTPVSKASLAPYQGFLAELSEKSRFYPQYYRFFLSIALDLFSLGVSGGDVSELSNRVKQLKVADLELSDLQRAEVRRLLLRTGIQLPDNGLIDRLRAFAETPRHFVLPNKKAAYELTHIVFYLSEYGRQNPGLGAAARVSLIYVGLIAYLEQNADLLAETCIALRFMGHVPPTAWVDWLEQVRQDYVVSPGYAGPDMYHEFLMVNWQAGTAGKTMFETATPNGPIQFHRPPVRDAPLRDMSQCLLDMAQRRSADWSRMRAPISNALSESARQVLEEAVQSTDLFEVFFEGFARADKTQAGMEAVQ